MEPALHILIYGPGAVGLGIASCLIRDGQSVSLLGRESTMAALRQHGLQRTGIFGDVFCGPSSFQCPRHLREVADESVDLVLVCVKSYDAAPAAEDLARERRILHPASRIVLFQNGWGNAEAFTAHFCPARIHQARVITGFEKSGPARVHITVHAADILLGSLFNGPVDALEPLSEAIRRGGIPCRVTPDIARDVWAKMLYNCTLNPVGALLQWPYGALGNSEPARRVMDRIAEEIFEVMRAHGFETHWPTAADYLDVFYSTLIPKTAAHQSSMLQDLRAGRRTEIDALNGAILRLAAQRAIPAPNNACIVDLIQAAESGRPAPPPLHRGDS